MIKPMLISIIMDIIMSIITKMIIMSIIRSIMNMMMLGIRISIWRIRSSKNKIIRRKRLEMERVTGISARRIPYHHFHNHPQSHHISPLTGTSSTLRFLPPVLLNIFMTTSRLTLPSCSKYCTLLARLSVPQSAIKLPSISKI